MDEVDQSKATPELIQAIAFNKEYVSMLLGKVTRESLEILKATPQVKYVPPVHPNRNRWECYSLVNYPTDFDWAMYKEGHDTNLRLAKENEDLKDTVEQQ